MKLLVLLLLPRLSLSEVVKGFGECRKFFLKNKPPEFTPQWVTTVQEICQCIRDNNKQPHNLYATLYNTDWRIPIYSAYKFKKSIDVGRCDPWYIEPQLELDDANAEACMACKQGGKDLDYQAMNSDYIGSDQFGIGYHKGHLYPVKHTDNTLSMEATSTLTNAAPQDKRFNQGKWRVHEGKVIEDLKACDRNVEAYVVTGVVPVDKNLPKLNNRVTVSKYYWRAFCCLLKNSKKRYIGQGYFGPNQTYEVETLSITALQTRLAEDYGVNKIVIFPGLSAPPPQPPTPPPNHKIPQEVEDPSIDDDCN